MLAIVGSTPFHPAIDGDLIPKTPGRGRVRGAGRTWTCTELDSGRAAAHSRDVGQRPDRAGTVRLVQRYVTMPSGHDVATGRAAELIDIYAQRLKGTSRNTEADRWAAVQTDGGMRLPARRFTEHARAGGLAYVSQFDWEAGGEPRHRGAFHAIDPPFAFGATNRGDRRAFLGADEGADRESQAIRTAWANFSPARRPTGLQSAPEVADPDGLSSEDFP
jgi:carboxylesterase type B